MPIAIFEEVKSYIGFDERDAENLRALGPAIRPRAGEIVERFYAEIMRHPGARSVLTGGREQLNRLRATLRNWIETLFTGKYDEAYVRERARIGEAHVRVALPQHYMFTALEVASQELHRIVWEENVPEAAAKLRSLRKLLTLETAIMLESYRTHYSERLRQAEQAAVQERLSRAEHLAEVGQLAASLAHEVKNPLAGISGAIQVIREGMAAHDPHRPILDEILRQIDRLDRTVKDLLTYARPYPPRLKPCDLIQVVRRVASLMRQEPALERVAIECPDCQNVEPIVADEHQIEQVLVNLLLNAAHASKPGQTVYVRVVPDGSHVLLSVEDHGHGMDEATRLRAFDPFFTTKARGTGLGLSICRGIVQAHRGSISVRSRPSVGTTVEVRLPRNTTPPQGEQP